MAVKRTRVQMKTAAALLIEARLERRCFDSSVVVVIELMVIPVSPRFKEKNSSCPERPGGCIVEAVETEDHPVEIPVDGELDLHAFLPRDLDDLVSRYLGECREKGILQVRLVHGKGTGALRNKVHAILRRTECVRSFGLAGDGAGGWGATIVLLRP
jgi:dsDNA-specific endonuclease/ATPase MutS2